MQDPQIIILKNGQFENSGRLRLAQTFDALASSPQKSCLALHFHGGLTPERAGVQIAERLQPHYQQANAYPVFIVWQSGFYDTLRNNWQEIVQEDAFGVLVERVLQFVVGKLDQSPGERGGTVELPTRFEIKSEVDAARAEQRVPFADRDDEATKCEDQLTPAEHSQFEQLLQTDSHLALASAKLLQKDGPAVSAELQTELKAASAGAPGEKGIVITTAVLVRAGLRILSRTLKRLASGRDHGIYATAVEEVARELKGNVLGGIVWKHMKKDTADSFDGSAETHGGMALLDEIARRYAGRQQPRIVLVGHSAGAVYICHFLKKAAERLPPEIRFEVVMLAPACTFKLLDAALTVAGDRVTRFRSFGMQDELEKGDALFRPIYLRSLLYFVSGLLEDDVDLPIVGMQRFHSLSAPFDGVAYPEIQRVVNRFSGFATPWVWSESKSGAGTNSSSRTHGDFDDDEATLASIVDLIRREGN